MITWKCWSVKCVMLNSKELWAWSSFFESFFWGFNKTKKNYKKEWILKFKSLFSNVALVWQLIFQKLFSRFAPHPWRLVPVQSKPAGRWHTFVDSAKVRFSCEVRASRCLQNATIRNVYGLNFLGTFLQDYQMKFKLFFL